ncbi:phage portal protein [Fictibacillus fluitans]|uniref:Phage portal protein n=1 Tax=Fictibacillus fluitans TaxID=3058422 RepID=A0ABT8HX13_9BACL|nr:phage portal protein [Fictibacillus sp. NE201]MDN4525329.1 phage portal protein [Fictibacillus sp. NE201]
MGLISYILGKNKEIDFMFDFELIQDTSKRIHLKQLALQVCTGMIARTISQSHFYVKDDKKKILKDDLYYSLNLRPNVNTTASYFWQTVTHKLINNNECLIIVTDDKQMLIADSFVRVGFAMVDDVFKEVEVKGFKFTRSFQNSEVIYLQYANENLTKLIDSLFTDYGELFGRILEFQKRKNQIRGVVDIEAITELNEEKQQKIQTYIDKLYQAFSDKPVAIIPQQKGYKYNEMTNTTQLQSVDEVNKVTGGFMDHVARALGIPLAMIRGDTTDIDKVTTSYMNFCIKPILNHLTDELNAKVIERDDFLAGRKLQIRPASYVNIFEIAVAFDKLISSGGFSSNDLREEAGFERVDDPLLDKYFITKNYQESSEALKGGENE